jgi:hypothetical protein
MLKPLAGIAIVAMLTLPVLAQVRHHRTPEPIVGHVENSVVGPGEGEAALNAAMADMQAATDAAANAAADAAAEAAGDNVATDATAYDANADMSMDTNMTMEGNMTMDTNMSMDTAAPRHRRRARPRHH